MRRSDPMALPVPLRTPAADPTRLRVPSDRPRHIPVIAEAGPRETVPVPRRTDHTTPLQARSACTDRITEGFTG